MSCYCGKSDCPKCSFSGGAKGDITVNIDDWLKERQAGPSGLTFPGTLPHPPGEPSHPDQVRLPANATPQERAEARAMQEKLRKRWQEREELAEREHLLDNTPRECVECSALRRHYKNDYVCYRCRDEQGGPA